MRIAMFGGTFDPFHAGHAAITRFVLSEWLADRVLLIPAPVPPHKDASRISPYEIRRKLIELASAGMENVEISDVERDRTGKSYSIDTLNELAAAHPGDEIILLIGGDSLATLHLWHLAHELVRNYTILTYPRPGSIVTEASLVTSGWSKAEAEKLLAGIMHDAPVFPLSATQIRQMLAEGRTLPPGTIADAEMDWIRKQNLYHK